MKKTLTTYDIADALKQDDNANWSYKGAQALAEYLEQCEEDTGEEMELDVVAIRCDFAEYQSLQEWAEDYFYDWKADLGIEESDDEDDIDGKIRQHIEDNGQLIEFDGGIIVSSF
jgi:hypothetical protein